MPSEEIKLHIQNYERELRHCELGLKQSPSSVYYKEQSISLNGIIWGLNLALVCMKEI